MPHHVSVPILNREQMQTSVKGADGEESLPRLLSVRETMTVHIASQV